MLIRTLLVLSALVMGACAQTPPPVATATSPTWLHPSTVPETARSSALVGALPIALARSTDDDRHLVTAFYRERDFAPVWHDGGPLAVGRTAAQATLVDAGVLTPAPLDRANVAAETGREVALTVAALRFGRVFGTATPDAGDRTVEAMLRALAKEVEQSAATRGRETRYTGHDAAIAHYANIVAAGGWPSVPPGPALSRGDIDPRMPVLRERVRVTGDGPGSGPAAMGTDPQIYDAALAQAVTAFQARHGLAADGVVGPATLRALNVTARERLAQLHRARDKARAIDRELTGRFILVNLPAFELRFVDAEELVFRTDVIVGSRRHATVEFSDRIEYLVFNPAWNVPHSISRNELLPDFRADPVAMSAKGYQVIDTTGERVAPESVDWTAVSASRLPYRFRQRPGAGNALGRVKFVFPNPHAIYLHDTPARSLFDRPMRALSHGCVRVRDPLDLAARVLARDGRMPGAIDAALGVSHEHRVTLETPVPVHLVYITAWTSADGTVQFRDDVYGRDGPLAAF